MNIKDSLFIGKPKAELERKKCTCLMNILSKVVAQFEPKAPVMGMAGRQPYKNELKNFINLARSEGYNLRHYKDIIAGRTGMGLLVPSRQFMEIYRNHSPIPDEENNMASMLALHTTLKMIDYCNNNGLPLYMVLFEQPDLINYPNGVTNYEIAWLDYLQTYEVIKLPEIVFIPYDDIEN